MPTDDEVWESEDYQKARQIKKRIYVSQQSKTSGFGPNLRAIVGICVTCKYYAFVMNNVHQLILSKCNVFDCRLGKHSIKRCSEYQEKGQIDLHTMFQIATPIDIDVISKEKPGFINKGR